MGVGEAVQAEDAQELGVELRLQGADGQVAAVGGLVGAVVRAAAVQEVGPAPVLPGAGGEHAVQQGGQVGGAVHDGGVHDLPGAVHARVVQRGEDADDQVEGAAREVAEEVGGHGRGPVGVADQAEGAGEGDVGHVVSGARGERAVLAPAGHAAVDQPGVAGVAVTGADAEALGDAGAVALDQDVGALGEVEDAGGPVGGLEVDHDGALVAVGDVVRGVEGESRAAGAVHPHHVGAEVGQEHGREGAGADPGEFDHAHAGERAVPGRPCRCHPAPLL